MISWAMMELLIFGLFPKTLVYREVVVIFHIGCVCVTRDEHRTWFALVARSTLWVSHVSHRSERSHLEVFGRALNILVLHE